MKLAANKIFSENENDLEREEPESSATNYFKYLKILTTLGVGTYLFIEIAIKMFKKIGKIKLQNTSTEMKKALYYNLTKYPPDELLPFHWFMELNKQDVVDRMECLINNDDDRCFEMDKQTCHARFEIKGK